MAHDEDEHKENERRRHGDGNALCQSTLPVSPGIDYFPGAAAVYGTTAGLRLTTRTNGKVDPLRHQFVHLITDQAVFGLRLESRHGIRFGRRLLHGNVYVLLARP